jgi:hypothetical protein
VCRNQHYDHHNYWLEKKQASKKWAARLARLKVSKPLDTGRLALSHELAAKGAQDAALHW